MLDRSIQPPLREIGDIALPKIQEHVLDNGIPVYEVNIGTQEVLKLEIVFQAGRPFEHQKLVARATAGLLREGTVRKKAKEIHETVDFYGSTLSIPIDLDVSTVALYSLKKHFEKLISLVTEVITEPAFAEEELNIFKKNNIVRLKEDLTKNDVIAYRTITEKIFESHHPYGYNSTEELYNNLKREDLIFHHKKNYTAANCKIFISGKTDEKIIALINQYLGKEIPKGLPSQNNIISSSPIPEKIKITSPDTVQTAIRIGGRMFSRRHEDYLGIYVLDAVLGGYFGSRLMTSIREEKGFTYNIFSSIDPMMYDGYFYIGTEVGNDYVEPTCKMIYEEFEKLKTEPVGKEELAMVQNYLGGFLLTTIDGAFNVAEITKLIKLQGLPETYLSDLSEKINSITPTEIMELSNKYLRKEKMWEVIVGI